MTGNKPPAQIVDEALSAHLEPIALREQTIALAVRKITENAFITNDAQALAAFKAVVKALMEVFPRDGYGSWYPGDNETKEGGRWPEVRGTIAKAMEHATGRD